MKIIISLFIVLQLATSVFAAGNVKLYTDLEFSDNSVQQKSAVIPICSSGDVLVNDSGVWSCGKIKLIPFGIATCTINTCYASSCEQGYHDNGSGLCIADTISGMLSLSAPTSSNNGDGTYTVSTTVTFTPSYGTSAQGIVVCTTATDNLSVIGSACNTLTSSSNSLIYFFSVSQLVGISNYVTIVSNTGEMNSSVVVVIPAIAPMSALPIDFYAGEAASPGTTKTTTISGGVGAYTLISPSSVNGVLTISITGSTLTVKYVSASAATAETTFITILDGAGSTLNIPVSYFK